MVSTFHFPPCIQKDGWFYTGSIEVETFFPCPQCSINPYPQVSQGTSLQCCAKHHLAAPTETWYSLVAEACWPLQMPITALRSCRVLHGRAGFGSEHLNHLRSTCLSCCHFALPVSALHALEGHLRICSTLRPAKAFLNKLRASHDTISTVICT